MYDVLELVVEILLYFWEGFNKNFSKKVVEIIKYYIKVSVISMINSY